MNYFFANASCHFKSRLFTFCYYKQEYVTKLEFSPDSLSISAIYVSGKLAIYSIPTLKLIQEWFMTEQVRPLFFLFKNI
jgi:hypothetical protein